MGFVGGMLGLGGGVNGTGISGPTNANIQNPTTSKQAEDAYKSNQDALTQQQSFLQAVQAQNGLGNQTSVFNQLQGVANGTGSNPAQAMLNNATGANVANQAALMAGQRGAGANVGLIARQAAQQGAATQQQAAGQGAAMQAQQSLGALNSLGSMANTQAAQQAAATGAVTSAQQNEQQQLLNSIAQQNNAKVGMQSNVNSANAGLAGQTMGMQGNLLGNVMGGVGSALGLAQGGIVHNYADGGGVYADPSSDPNNPFNNDNSAPMQLPTPALPSVPAPSSPGQAQPAPAQGPKSNIGKHFSPDWNLGDIKQPTGSGAVGNYIGKGIGAGIKGLIGAFSSPADVSAPTQMSMDSGQMMAAHGGRVPALVSPGEQYIPPKEMKKVQEGKNPLSVGERIPGKPKHPGNDYRNDTVKKNLQEGGVVIPNDIMQSKDAEKKAAEFVRAILAKQNPKKPRK